MADSPFVDYVKIYFRSGRGGSGVISWRREKFVPKGGPDGGDGGEGGSIILRANSQLWTLLDLKYRKNIHAENGEHGGGSRKTGKSGKNEVLEVPLGTVVKNAETGEELGELTEDGQELLLLPGGKGGKGNFQFRTPTNQAPDFSTLGKPGEELVAVIELKILADVGLVGFPNAGKSTLLSVLSEARPKIADYPFTTLVPNLGIVRYAGFKSFVMADIPGIIEGAHLGKGLGSQFLRHIERNSVLLFMIPADSDDIRKEYEILLKELELYNPDLLETPRMVAVSKSDLLDQELMDEVRKELSGIDHVFISAVAEQGLDVLKNELWRLLHLENA
jgi:GTP-binding protein